MQWIGLLHQRSSKKKGYWMNLKKKKKFVQGRSWNGYCQFPALGRDLVWRSRHAKVATRKWHRDLAGLQWVSGWTVGIDVATSFEVATWVAAREVATWRRDVAEMRLR